MSQNRTMRAWQSGDAPGRDAIALTDCAVPSPGAGEALVRVSYAALNFADLLMIDDAYQVRPPRPFVPGQEVAGVVVETGDGCALQDGDRVASKVVWGGFAEYAIVRGDMAIPVPGDVDLQTAVALPVAYPTAVVAFCESTTVRDGECVLIHAATGGVGLAAVQVAKALGARVLATAGSAEKCALARSHGAEQAFDYRNDDWVAGVREAAGDPKQGGGVDVIYDPVGGDITTESLRCLAWEGRLLIVGFSSGDIPQIPANRLLLKRASAIGVYWSHDRDVEMMPRITERIVGWAREGKIRPVVDADYALEDLPRALDDLAARRAAGKLALRMASEGEGPGV